MKYFFACIMLSMCLQAREKNASLPPVIPIKSPVKNLIIVTIDGFRWQEIFNGADSSIINNELYTPDRETTALMYWDKDMQVRRKKLLPFFWNVIARQGQLFGNREYDNRVNVSNIYSLSYPGYNEIFTGHTDLNISSNSRKINPNVNVLEYLNRSVKYSGQIAAFTSWNVFPFILNGERSGLEINSGYEGVNARDTNQSFLSKVISEAVYDKKDTRQDALTFITAREHLRKFHPAILYLGFGETDEMAHQRRYDLYLEKAAQFDQMLGQLWHWIQTTEGYKNNTSMIVTTDHGRGRSESSWFNHGIFVPGSSQTWIAMIGPNIEPAGEQRGHGQLYEKQMAPTITALLGTDFSRLSTVVAAQ